MFFEGIRSECQLIATASLNLADRYYLGYAPDEALPNHSSLTRIRQRLGIDVFQRFFEQVVDLCQEAGQVWGKELYFDATKVEANAGIPSLIPRFYYDATTHVADLFVGDSPRRRQSQRRQTTCPKASCGCRSRSTPRASSGDDPPWRLLEARRLDPHRPPTAATDAPATSASVPPTRMPPRCGTGARSVWATTTTTWWMAGSAASSSRRSSRQPMSWRTSRCRTCCGGSASAARSGPTRSPGTPPTARTENIVALEDAGIRAYVPLPDFAHRPPSTARTTSPTMPSATHTAARRPPAARERVKYTEGVIVYRAEAATCNACPVKAKCTDKRPRPHRPALLLRRLSGEGARLPRHGGLQEGDAQAPGLGRAAVCRGQGLARLTPLPATGA